MASSADDRANGQAQERGRGQRGTVTSRPSRDTILQSYAVQDAERAQRTRDHASAALQELERTAARNADREAQRRALMERQREQEELRERLHQEEVANRQRAAQMAAVRQRALMREEQAPERAGRDMVAMRDTDEMYARAAEVGRRGHASHPLSSAEGRERSRVAQETYEFERASRDALSGSTYGRRGEREIIDARGSIDSRAFSERDQLIGYSIDEDDKPEPAIDASLTQTRWHSRAGQGFDNVPDAGRQRRVPLPGVGFQGAKPMGGFVDPPSAFRKPGLGMLPKAIIAVALIVLVIVLAAVFL